VLRTSHSTMHRPLQRGADVQTWPLSCASVGNFMNVCTYILANVMHVCTQDSGYFFAGLLACNALCVGVCVLHIVGCVCFTHGRVCVCYT